MRARGSRLLERMPQWVDKQQRCQLAGCGKKCLTTCPGCAEHADGGPASGFYCHGKGRDCLAVHHRKLALTAA